MFIPLGTNRALKRRPIVSESLILVNLLVYLTGLIGGSLGGFDLDRMVAAGRLWREDFHVWQLLSYQFLHDPRDIWHLGFNMLFLWVFGRAVEDRLGRLSYLGFYLIGGAVAGAAHMMISDNKVIGASGSIAALTGAFLALFPRSRMKVLVIFFIIGLYEIPSLWFIGFYFAMDVLRHGLSLLGGTDERVAYMAHIAGTIYGFTLAFLLLGIGLIKREEFDVFYLFKQARRRAAFRATSRGQTGGLWESSSADMTRQLEKRAKPNRRGGELTAKQTRRGEARAEITRLAAAHDLPAAATRYAALLAEEDPPSSVFPEQTQLDLANQFQASQDHLRAAQAYELLLKTYPLCASAAEVRLILAVIYARRLGQPRQARVHLEQAMARLVDPEQKALAEQILSETKA